MNDISEVVDSNIQEPINENKKKKVVSALSYGLMQGVLCSVIILAVVVARIFMPNGYSYVLDKIHTCSSESVVPIIKQLYEKEKEIDNKEMIANARENNLYMGDALFYSSADKDNKTDESSKVDLSGNINEDNKTENEEAQNSQDEQTDNKNESDTIKNNEQSENTLSDNEIKYNYVDKKIDTPVKLSMPVIGGWISSGFGVREDPFNSDNEKFHSGVDIAVNLGTKVCSIMDGVVAKTGNDSIGGKYIIITHSNGFTSYYGHLDEILVKVNQTVTKGSKIALSGNSGKTTGAHLHFGMQKDDKYLNPLYYFDFGE